MRHSISQRGFTLIELLVIIAIVGVIVAVVALNVGGFFGSHNATEGEVMEFELVGEGILTEFEVSDLGWRIGFGDTIFVVDPRHCVIWENPVRLGKYYYLYQDTVGSITWSIPYKLTQEELDGI